MPAEEDAALFFIDTGNSLNPVTSISVNGEGSECGLQSVNEETERKTEEPKGKSGKKLRDKSKQVLKYAARAHNKRDDIELERIVFGDDPGALLADKQGGESDFKNDTIKDATDSAHKETVYPFYISTQRQEGDLSDEGEPLIVTTANKRKPAWEDDDDKHLRVHLKSQKRLKKLRETEEEDEVTGTKYEQKLRSQFNKLVGNPNWASVTDTKQKDEDDIASSAVNYLGKSERLAPSVIDIQQFRNVNQSKVYTSPLKCVEFHPQSKVVLTAARGNTFDLFQIDGKGHKKIQTVYLEKFPLTCAHFGAQGEEVIVSGLKRHFYVYDMVASKVTTVPGIRGQKENILDTFAISPDSKYIAFKGSNGYVHLLSGRTKQWVHSFKMNSSVRNIAFTHDGNRVLTSGGSSEVYLWDIRTRRCVHKFYDDGCVKATSIAVSPNGQFIACGSNSGVVNIYDDQCLLKDTPIPVKSVMNLTTAITSLRFNSTSEILAAASGIMKDKIKLIHTSSMTVFQNWPSPRTFIGHVECLDFSANSGYLSIGDNKGKVKLYRLHHYPEA